MQAASQQAQPAQETLDEERNPPGSPVMAEDMQVDATAAEQGKTKKHEDAFVAPHPGLELSSRGETTAEKADYMMHHPVYDKEYLESVKPIEHPATEVLSPLIKPIAIGGCFDTCAKHLFQRILAHALKVQKVM
jgi:hypothetical protein